MAGTHDKVVFISGATSGMGAHCAHRLKDMGYRVYGGSRRVQGNQTVEHGAGGGFLRLVNLDVTNDDSVKSAVNTMLDAEGGVGAAIICAGYALSGAVEDITPSEAMTQFDTNTFGALRVFRAVLPSMRQERDGTIVVVGSVAGFVPVPYQSMYSASKYALGAMTEALRMEVRPFGIRVSLVEPGDVKTGFTSARVWAKKPLGESAYAKRCKKAVDAMAKSEQSAPGPECVTSAILSALRSSDPPVRTIVGTKYKAFGALKRLLPDRLVHWIVEKIY